MKIKITKEIRGNNISYFAEAEGCISSGATEEKAIQNLKQTLHNKLRLETYVVDVDFNIDKYKKSWYNRFIETVINILYLISNEIY